MALLAEGGRELTCRAIPQSRDMLTQERQSRRCAALPIRVARAAFAGSSGEVVIVALLLPLVSLWLVSTATATADGVCRRQSVPLLWWYGDRVPGDNVVEISVRHRDTSVGRDCGTAKYCASAVIWQRGETLGNVAAGRQLWRQFLGTSSEGVPDQCPVTSATNMVTAASDGRSAVSAAAVAAACLAGSCVAASRSDKVHVPASSADSANASTTKHSASDVNSPQAASVSGVSTCCWPAWDRKATVDARQTARAVSPATSAALVKLINFYRAKATPASSSQPSSLLRAGSTVGTSTTMKGAKFPK